MRLNNWFITNPDASQQEVLKVSINDNLIVKGAAGSGKTNMAIYRANQTSDNSFIIVVYTVALKKMVRFGLSELGLDRDRVVHEWSWIHRGIELTGDLFCLRDSKNNINSDLLILKTADEIRYFVSKEKYDEIIHKKQFKNYTVKTLEKSTEVSIDFDDWVDDELYKTFNRRKRRFKEVVLEHLKPHNINKNFELVPSGFLFKEIENINYLIIDEGQDFSIENYRKNFIPKTKASITIFGDTSQQLYKQKGTSIDNIQRILKYKLKELQFNYRIPKTIAKIAQNIKVPHIDLITHNKKKQW